jgi:hypothetical protein
MYFAMYGQFVVIKKKTGRQILFCSKTVVSKVQKNCPTPLTIGDFGKVQHEDILSGHAKLRQIIYVLKFEIPLMMTMHIFTTFRIFILSIAQNHLKATYFDSALTILPMNDLKAA